MSALQPGTCRHCQCTEGNACMLGHGETCWWMDNDRLVCSNPDCIKAEKARLARARAERPASKYKGWGYGAIVDDLRKQKRRRRAA